MNTYKKIIFVILLLPLISCSDWLNLKPENEATSDQLFEIGDGYRSVLNGLYKKMGEAPLYGVELQFGIIDCISRQYRLSSGSIGGSIAQKYIAAQEFDYTHNDLQPEIEKIWLTGYNIIANANNLIQNIKNENPDKFELGEIERSMIMGEAYACRAFMHFDLLRLFAPAPINDDGGTYIPYVDRYPNVQANGITVKETIKKIIADLDIASSLTHQYDTTSMAQSFSATGKARFYRESIPAWPNYTEINDFYKSRGYRLSYYAITALQARVYQYAEMYDKAFEAAEKVMNFKAISPTGNTYEMFTSENFDGFQYSEDREEYTDLKVVSTLIFGVYNALAYEKNSLTNFFAKKTDGIKEVNWLQFDIDGQKIFMNTQESSINEYDMDIRYKRLIFLADGYKPISGKWYLSNNTKIRDDNVTIMPIIRTTEMRYIMAEHHARKGDFTQAYQIINELRERRSAEPWTERALQPYKVKNDMVSFLTDFIGEARREWLSEGQLFYLYKRLNYEVKLSEGETRPLRRNEYLFPIPNDQNI